MQVLLSVTLNKFLTPKNPLPGEMRGQNPCRASRAFIPEFEKEGLRKASGGGGESRIWPRKG